MEKEITIRKKKGNNLFIPLLAFLFIVFYFLICIFIDELEKVDSCYGKTFKETALMNELSDEALITIRYDYTEDFIKSEKYKGNYMPPLSGEIQIKRSEIKVDDIQFIIIRDKAYPAYNKKEVILKIDSPDFKNNVSNINNYMESSKKDIDENSILLAKDVKKLKLNILLFLLIVYIFFIMIDTVTPKDKKFDE